MKGIISFVTIIILAIIAVNIAFSIVALWSKKDVLTQTRLELQKEEAQHAKLQTQWQQVNSPDFIEQQARDKLFLSKPGEAVVLFPTASASGSVTQNAANKPILQQWWELFF